MTHATLLRAAFASSLAFTFFAGPVRLSAEESASDLEELKKQMRELMRQNAQQQKQIEDLQKQIEGLRAGAAPTPAAKPAAAAPADKRLDEALSEIAAERPAPGPAGPSQPALLSRQVGGAQLRLIDVSFDILAAAGTSTESDSSIRELQGGGHDPARRGFTLQQGELSLAGAVDPYLYGESHVVFTTDSVELEEAFFQTTSLPFGLQLEGGHFLTEFGRMNPTHPHAWRWIDQPVILTRLFGGDGLRAPGMRVGWLTPLPWFSEIHVGAQNGNEGETTLSFLSGEPPGGRPAVHTDVKDLADMLYLARWENAWDITPELSALVGFSGLFGSNSTGNDARTFIYGTDLTFKWVGSNNFRGWPFLEWQTEALKRDYTAASFVATAPAASGGGAHGDEEEAGSSDEFPNDLPSAILRDWGGYSQLLWGFRYPWAAGIRFEYASGHEPSVEDGALVSRSEDPFRDDRYRVSPIIIYRPTEFSRLRLQYNFDDAQHLSHGDAHSVWLGMEVLYGSHAAHKY